MSDDHADGIMLEAAARFLSGSGKVRVLSDYRYEVTVVGTVVPVAARMRTGIRIQLVPVAKGRKKRALDWYKGIEWMLIAEE